MNTKNLQVSTPTDTAIVLTRRFHAPRRLVWQAMFIPDKMRRWMVPPPGWTMMACECDACVGGAIRLGWKGEDAASVMTIYGVFTEVAPHQRMVHTEAMVMGSGEMIGALVETHEYAEEDGVTTMRITQVYGSKDARDAAVSSGMEQGMEAGYAQLDLLLGQPA